MAQNSARNPGRHFLQIPGPTPLPDRVLRAMDTPIIDHRGPEFAKITKKALEGIKTIFKTTNPVVIYTATGTGAWEGALVNTLSPGDRVLMVETGQFATLWKKMAERLGLKPEFITTDWRQGIDPKAVEAKLREDKSKSIKAVCVLHNETSTGALTPIAEIRKAIDAAGHPALFMVDTISSLASADYRHDEWGVDVSIGGAQKGLMMPPGMSFNAISDKALAAAKSSKLPKSTDHCFINLLRRKDSNAGRVCTSDCWRRATDFIFSGASFCRIAWTKNSFRETRNGSSVLGGDEPFVRTYHPARGRPCS